MDLSHYLPERKMPTFQMQPTGEDRHAVIQESRPDPSSKRAMNSQELLKDRKFRWLVATLIVITPFEVLSLLSIHLPLWVELPLFLLIITVFGKDAFVSGIKSLLKLNVSNMNLLMSIATFGALYLRQFEEAVIIIVLFALGNTLEKFGITRSQAALKIGTDPI